jgi:SAM-dependent MidA family methyltransferase
VPTVTDILRAEIAAAGPVSCARFMDAALYTPGLGYYERQPGRIGRAGDYFTSVSVGPVFGQCLAARFATWLNALEADRPQQLVELGPHDGRLARDLLDALATVAPPSGLARLDYVLVDPSPARRAWQAERLAPHRDRVGWVADLAELAPGSVNGVIFGNEFFDALPVHRLGWDAAARDWFEWRVGWDGARFCWVRSRPGGTRDLPAAELRAALAAEYPALSDPAVQTALPDGFTVEVCPAARALWTAAARALGTGWLVALDYGPDREALRPEQPAGTLRAFTRHHQTADVLAAPGEQDLTADVNFPALAAAGERAGLQTVTLCAQGRFLVEALREQPLAAGWSAAQRRQFQTLIHPQHLGERFKVLVQTRRPTRR